MGSLKSKASLFCKDFMTSVDICCRAPAVLSSWGAFIFKALDVPGIRSKGEHGWMTREGRLSKLPKTLETHDWLVLLFSQALFGKDYSNGLMFFGLEGLQTTKQINPNRTKPAEGSGTFLGRGVQPLGRLGWSKETKFHLYFGWCLIALAWRSLAF